jgi:hypothetical protein
MCARGLSYVLQKAVHAASRKPVYCAFGLPRCEASAGLQRHGCACRDCPAQHARYIALKLQDRLRQRISKTQVVIGPASLDLRQLASLAALRAPLSRLGALATAQSQVNNRPDGPQPAPRAPTHPYWRRFLARGSY